MDPKEQVVRTLKEIALLLRVRGESPYRVRAYETGADRIAQVQGDLGELVRSGRLTQMPGIGDALAAKIEEIVRTGRSQLHEALTRDFPPGLLDLTQLPELGPKKAQALWRALGIRDLDALERACRERKVREVPGFGERSEARLLEAIAALRAAPPTPTRSKLGAVLPRANELLATLRRAPGVVRAEVAGSVRRSCEEVDDFVLVVAAPEPRSVLTTFGTVDVRASSNGRYELILLDGHHVDLHVVAAETFEAAWLVHTGTEGHVQKLAAIAQRLGFTLGADGLRRGGAPVKGATEATIYEALGLPFIPPELREDSGEVEAALRGTRFDDLLALDDVVGVVHSHSTWSDGRASLEEMAEAARARGLRYLTVTEHSQTAGYAGGLREDALKRQWAEIDRLNAKLDGITLLKGIESDILADGSLDYPDRILERLDVVIGSVHQRHKMDAPQMTRRILKAFENPHLHILGHATGRLLQRRDPAPMDMERILDEAAERGVAVEVNGNPERLDLKAAHVRQALERGVRLVVSADAHSPRELDHLGYAVATARKGWARKKDVLNTKAAEDFSADLRNARR